MEQAASWNDPVPQVAMVVLRVTYADGQGREFTAPRPRDLDVKINTPLLLPFLPPVSPLVIEDCELTRVEMRFKSNLREPITVRVVSDDVSVTVSRDDLRAVLDAGSYASTGSPLAVALANLSSALGAKVP
jgi:hypothetical protein